MIDEYGINYALEKKIKKSISLLRKNFLDDKEELLGILPEILKSSVEKCLYSYQITNLEFFKNKSAEFVYYCSKQIKLQRPVAKEVIV